MQKNNKDKKVFDKLRRFNIYMGGAHALQAVLLIILSSDFSKDLTVNYLVFDQATQGLVSQTREVVNFSFVWGVAGFSLLSMLFHWLIASVWFDSYVADLKKGLNRYRWYEYSLSASLMIVLIAILSGVYDISSLLLMFGATAVMNLMGLMMEVHNQSTKQTHWLAYWIGVLAGALPWLVIALYFWAGATAPETDAGPPGFVYAIWVSIFLFFNSFAINMYLQYKKIGKWQDYLFGERAYIWLSLAAKSALIWQIFAGTLQP